MCHKSRTPQDMNKTNLWSNQIGTKKKSANENYSVFAYEKKIIIKHLFHGLSNLNKLKHRSVGNVCNKTNQRADFVVDEHGQRCVFLLDKQHFAHTWHLLKTITGAVGLKAIRLNLHVWTQHIWGDKTTDQSDIWWEHNSVNKQYSEAIQLPFIIFKPDLALLSQIIDFKRGQMMLGCFRQRWPHSLDTDIRSEQTSRPPSLPSDVWGGQRVGGGWLYRRQGAHSQARGLRTV